MKKQHIYILFGLLMTMLSCKKASFIDYQDVDRLQFGPPDPEKIYWSDYEKTWKWADTTKSYSFYFEAPKIVQDTLYFDLYTLGQIADFDRPFKLVQKAVAGAENAVAGKHYLAFDNEKAKSLYVVKAGQSHLRVPIVLLRDASLKEKPYTLYLELAPNEHFQPGPSTNIWRKAIIADRLLQPSAWTDDAARYYWGKYSTVKHQFMIDATDLLWDQSMMENLAYDETNYYKAELKKALADYNAKHPGNPLTDEFNELVIFP